MKKIQFKFRREFRLPLLFFVVAIALLFSVTVAQRSYDPVVPPFISLLRYAGYFTFLLAGFSFFAKLKKGAVSSVFFFGMLVMVVEVSCFFLLGMPDKEIKEFSTVDDPDHITSHLGQVPYADTIMTDLKIVGADTSYDVSYTIDKHYKRVTPGFDKEKNEHALFFGCSVGFGHGLEDDETLPYHFQELSDSHNSYNYAYSGNGTSQMLARLQYEDLSEQVEGENGVAFYVFFWDHIYRTIGAMSRYVDWVHNAPNYYLEDGKVIRDGSLKTGRWSSWFYEKIYQSSIVNFFGLDFPLSLKDDHYELMCEIIAESKREYDKQFGDTEFYVVLYPSYLPEIEGAWDFEKFKKMLDERSIKYIDIFNTIDYGSKYTFVGDGHPNAETSRLMGEELHKRYLEISKQ